MTSRASIRARRVCGGPELVVCSVAEMSETFCRACPNQEKGAQTSPLALVGCSRICFTRIVVDGATVRKRHRSSRDQVIELGDEQTALGKEKNSAS